MPIVCPCYFYHPIVYLNFLNFSLAPDINIGDKLIDEGLADVLTSNNGNHRSGDVLRLDGGDGPSDSKSKINGKEMLDNRDGENDKFSGLSKSINGNSKHISEKTNSSSFIDVEKQNGNKVISENDIQTIDKNSNKSYNVT